MNCLTQLLVTVDETELRLTCVRQQLTLTAWLQLYNATIRNKHFKANLSTLCTNISSTDILSTLYPTSNLSYIFICNFSLYFQRPVLLYKFHPNSSFGGTWCYNVC